MNNESHCLEPDISLPIQDRIDILFREIELAVRWNRPSILFAIYKSDIVRDEVNTLILEKLKKIDQKTHSIKTSFNNQFDFLEQISKLPDLSQTVLVIDGFNWECGVEGARIFKEFNKNREYFIDNNIRAIFWLFENEVSDFAANATECWILRHRVVEFVDVPQLEQESIQSLESLWQRPENIPTGEYLLANSPEEKLILQDSVKVHASRANSFLNLGILFWRKGNLKRALKYVRASEKISESLVNTSLLAQCQNALALIHTELGNIEEAVSAYQRAISLSPESEFLWNNLGQLLAKNERNDEAINAFNKALSYSPRDFLSWNGIGHIYIKLGLFQNAISAFEKVLEIAPHYESSWAGIGKAYLESAQLEKAEVSLRKAVELNPHLIDAWKNLGRCFTQQKRDIDAIAVYRKANEFNPQIADLWDELGRLLLQRQNYAESISAFKKVITLNPQCSETPIRLAHALFQIGDYETSASIYEQNIPLFDDIATRSALFNRLGDAYLYMKDYEKAIGAYRQSEQLLSEHKIISEKNVELKIEIHEMDLNNDQKEDQDNSGQERGDEMIEANHVFDLKTAAEWNEHGNAHFKAGAYNDAIVAYTKAIELAPDACWPYIQNLAQVHYQKGKARGKLLVGKIEDPDVWEGEDEADSAPIFGYDAILNPEQSNDNEDPRLEKSNKKINADQAPADSEVEKPYSNDTDPVVDCSKNKNETDMNLNPVEEATDEMTGNCNTKIEAPQNIEGGVAIPSDQSHTSHLEEKCPQNSGDWNELGNSFTTSQKYNNAIEAYKKAIEMDPKNGQPYVNLGFIYYRLGKYDFAVLLYKKSIELLDSPEDKAISWNRLGDSYRRLGDYGNALDAYKKSSEMEPAKSPVMARARATLLESIVAG
ncbi:MAG TPA: tetratricopeptide repeat protein [Anaerolineales bacterium]